MKLKLGLVGPHQTTKDIVVTLEPSVTIADLAGTIARRDPGGRDRALRGPLTLALWSETGPRPIPPDFTLLEAALRSGATVKVVEQQPSTAGAASAPRVAVVRVLSGPDAGQEFEVPEGTTYIGRGESCDIRLSDPMVSNQHAKLHVTTVPELVDTNSANGVLVDDEVVARAVLRPEDRATLGETVIAVAMYNAAGGAGDQGTAIPFNRSPLVSPLYPERELETPELPQAMQRQRMQVVPMVTPVVMGTVLYFTTHSILSFAMVGLTPLMYVGNYVEGHVTRRRTFRAGMQGFRAALADLEEDLAAGAAEEHQVRLGEHPSVAELAGAVEQLEPLTWTRRPDDTRFLQVRLGLGALPSRTTLKLPRNARQRSAGYGEIVELQRRYASVEGVPVTADLRQSALGISGDDGLTMDVARGVIGQVAGLHSPAEVVVAAFASAETAHHWDWLKWTPHVSPPNSPLQGPHLAVGHSACTSLVGELEALIEARSGREKPRGDDVQVVVLVEHDAAADRSRLVSIAEHGPAAGVAVVWHAPATEQLPAACRTYVEVDRNAGAVRAVDVDARREVPLSGVERLDLPAALRLARRMAPLVDVGARVEDASDLPSSVSFVTLAGPELASEAAAVLERWNESNSVVDRRPDAPRRRLKESGLRAIIGRSATDSLHLDLRANGPHALVGGTTGAGKSELLQSWIIGMAATYSPDRVTFLLVDYKGGSAFGDCANLPHTVGMVTDLSLHLARRALTSLVAELRYREHVLSRKRAKDLIELERTGDPETPPSLVIVIDEFAALVQELPEFVDGVVNVAQRGRSLGLHLVLATQRPAGVIKDNLRANTNLRIALRMADEADSADVLGTPVAASFDPGRPGRAMAKLGPGRLVAFQSAYVGGRTSDTPPPPPVDVEDLVFGPVRRWEEPPEEEAAAGHDEATGPTDIRRLVDTMRRAADTGGIPRPRLPWLSELAPIYELSKLPMTRKDSEMVFGVRDDPEHQSQPLAVFHPDRDGNMVIYGTGGAGKSTSLRTLAITAGLNVRGGPCHVYGLDFGSRGLDALADLPHVGAVVPGDDDERVARLLRMLRATIDERAPRYARAKAATVTEYRALADKPDEPRILLLVDAIGGFRQAYETSEKAKLFETFVGIAQDGRPVGVHVVATADRPGAMPSTVASSMQRSLVLRMASDNDTIALGAPVGVLNKDSPPGRGFQDRMELQVAVLGGSANVADQAVAIERLAAAMRRNDVGEAPPVERLRDRITLGELPAALDSAAVIGVADETLGPFGIAPKGTFLVSGPPGSGRTTALATIAMALRRFRPETVLCFYGPPTSLLAGLLDWESMALGPDLIADAAPKLAEGVLSGAVGKRPVALVVEGIGDLLNTPADFPLQECIGKLVSAGHFVVADGDPGVVGGSWPLLQAVKVSRCGVALQPEQTEGQIVFKTNFPRVNRAQFPQGRGLYVTSGRASVVQLALPDLTGSSPHP